MKTCRLDEHKKEDKSTCAFQGTPSGFDCLRCIIVGCQIEFSRIVDASEKFIIPLREADNFLKGFVALVDRINNLRELTEILFPEECARVAKEMEEKGYQMVQGLRNRLKIIKNGSNVTYRV